MNLYNVKKGPALVVLSCFAVTSAVFLYVKFGRKNPGFPQGRGGAGESIVSVKTQTAAVSTLHDYVITNGEIQPQTSVDVFPDRGGKIASVEVTLGSYVKKGTVIAKVDPSEPGAQYAQSPVYAPISGTVISSPLKVGTKVSASTVITAIGDVQNLQITANVPERFVSSLKTGLKADIVLESYPDQKFSATVTRVSPVVDQQSRTKEVIMNFDRADQRVNAGMFAKVTLWTEDYSGFITIPSAAVVTKNLNQVVYIVNEDNETVRTSPVKTGKSVDSMIQVTEGINPGDKVVIEGMRILSEGAKIQVISDGGNDAQ